MKKKKINSKRSYKKGGEAWVSEKMANLPMYKIAGMVPQSIDLKLKPFGLQPEQSQLDPNNLTLGQDWAKTNPNPQLQQIGNKKGFSYDLNAAASIENFKPSDALKQEEVQEYKDYTTPDNEGEERQPFFNPYGGYDLATSAGMLGQAIKEKNTLGIVGSSAKLLTGLGRNVMGGMGLANRENFIQGEYDDNVRNSQRPRTMAMEGGGMIDFMQEGGNKYQKTGDTDISELDAENIRKGTGIQFTPEFAQAYFSTQSKKKPMTNPKQYLSNNVVDITSDGQFTDRKVWRKQRPEWYVGKQEAVEGTDYTTVPYKQWENYKTGPEYSQFKSVRTDNRVVEFQDGGEQPQGGQDQMMQQVAQALQGGAPPEEVLQQLVQAGVPQEQATQIIQGIMQQLQGQQQEQQVMQRGGQIAKKLTGEYTLEEEENPNVNSEIEHNEYVQTPDGKVTKADGNTHEKGGIEVELAPGTRIVSDHLKLGAKNAKHYKEDFDLEVKASDTYAKVLKRFTTKSGLQKIVDEQERVIAQLKKSEEAAQGSTMSESTAALNKQFLSEKLHSLEQEKAPLEEARKALLEDVFNLQEESKPAEKKEQNEFQNGGYMDLANQYGVTPERAQELVNQYKNGGMHEYSEGGDYDVPNSNSGKYSPATLGNPFHYSKERADEDAYLRVDGDAPEFTAEEKAAMKRYYAKFTKDAASLKKLEESIDNNQIVFNEGLLVDITTGEKLPIPLQHEKGKTYGGQDAERINNYVYKETFKQMTGRDFKPGDNKEDTLIYNKVAPALKARGVMWNGAPFKGQKVEGYGNINASQPGFVDATGAKVAGTLDMDKFRSATEEQKQRIAEHTGVSMENLVKYASDPSSKYLKLTPNPTPKVEEPIKTPAVIGATQGTETPSYEADIEQQQGRGAQFLNLPDQSPMMPDSLTGALKITRRYDRVDPMQLTSTGQVSELQGQANAAMQNINLQPGAEAGAAGANISAITQQNIAKTNSEVNRANMGQDAQAQQFNAQVQIQEENARGLDLKDYESKIYQAQATTDANIRGYYNQLKAADLANYNAVNNVNAMNQMYDHFGYTNNGVAMTGDQTEFDINNYLKLQETKAAKKTRTKSARFGGKAK